jgi:hypothetical protein
MSKAKMLNFLNLVATSNWRMPPAAWNKPFREALNEGLVTVGWGGVLKLTDAGRAYGQQVEEK